VPGASALRVRGVTVVAAPESAPGPAGSRAPGEAPAPASVRVPAPGREPALSVAAGRGEDGPGRVPAAAGEATQAQGAITASEAVSPEVGEAAGPAAEARFRVSIRDRRGHRIEVEPGAGSLPRGRVAGPEARVEDGRWVVRWRTGPLEARAFRVLREGPGGEAVEVARVPSFSHGGHGAYRYRLVDGEAQVGRVYRYRLELLRWGARAPEGEGGSPGIVLSRDGG